MSGGSQQAPTPDGSARTFGRIAAVATGLSFAIVLGSVACVDWSPAAGLGFRWRWAALLWMGVGLAAGGYLWLLIGRLETAPSHAAQRRLVIYCIVLLLAGLAVFAYPFRFVPPEKFRDVLIGLAAALFVLSFAGWMLFRLFRALSKSDSPSQQLPKV